MDVSGGGGYNLDKNRMHIGEMLLLFSIFYIIILFVKRIYPSKIFFTNPLLIIYTPLETSGSSPTGCFILRKIKSSEGVFQIPFSVLWHMVYWRE